MALGNINAAITGTNPRAVNCKYLPRYLAEFAYRFNRRYDLAAMILRRRRPAPALNWLRFMRNRRW